MRQAKLNGQFGAQSLRIVNDQAEALEFLATKTFAGLSKPLKALSIKSNLIIACILRDNNVITPHGDQTIEGG